MAYPTLQPAKITFGSTDYSANIDFNSIDIDDKEGSSPPTTPLLIMNAGALTIYDYQTVIIQKTDESERYFGGIITQRREIPRAGQIDVELQCTGFAWDLYNAETDVDENYLSDPDRTIIRNILNTTSTDIDSSTSVATINSTISIEFDHVQPGEALEAIAKRTDNATWYVDYGPGTLAGTKADLHYFAEGNEAAPFDLDDEANADFTTSYPHYNLVKEVQMGPNRVHVIGATTLVSITVTAGQESDYGRWITHTIQDENITTTASANERGNAYLAEHGPNPVYTCMVLEPGLRAGQQINVTSTDLGLSSEALMIRRVRTTYNSPDGRIEQHLELGRRIPRLAELLRRRLGGAGGGGGNAPRNHQHTGGADSPPIESGGMDVAHTLSGSTGAPNQASINVASDGHSHTFSGSTASPSESSINVATDGHGHSLTNYNVREKSVASAGHDHASLTGNTGTENDTVAVASSVHTHTTNLSSQAVASTTHTHTESGGGETDPPSAGGAQTVAAFSDNATSGPGGGGTRTVADQNHTHGAGTLATTGGPDATTDVVGTGAGFPASATTLVHDVGGPDDTVAVAPYNHTHPPGTLALGGPDDTVVVAPYSHTHPPGTLNVAHS